MPFGSAETLPVDRIDVDGDMDAGAFRQEFGNSRRPQAEELAMGITRSPER